MLKKLKQLKSKATPKQKEEKEKDGKALSGAPKYAVAGLGVMVMLVGIGFVTMQMLGGGKSQEQMMVAQQQEHQDSLEQDQDKKEQSDRLQALKEDASQSGSDTKTDLDAPREQKGASAPGDKKIEKEARSPGNEEMKKKLLNKPLEETRETRETRDSAPQQTVTKKVEDERMDEVMEKLASIEDSVSGVEDSVSGAMDEITLALKGLRGDISDNGARIENLTAKVKDVSGNSGADKERLANLLNEKRELEDQVEELEGKYKWVRHLENKKNDEVKGLRQELNDTREKLDRLAKRPVFGEWKLAGLSEDEMLLVNPYSRDVKRLKPGDRFQGVTIKQIDASSGVVTTDAGSVKIG